MDCEPLTALAPDHAPEAVHEVALVDDQVKLALLPLVIVLGLAVKATVGRAGLPTPCSTAWRCPRAPCS